MIGANDDEPLYSCRNSNCADEITHVADDLAHHPEGGLVCQDCWNSGEYGENYSPWAELHPFISHKRERDLLIETLKYLHSMLNPGAFDDPNTLVAAMGKRILSLRELIEAVKEEGRMEELSTDVHTLSPFRAKRRTMLKDYLETGIKKYDA